MGSLKVLRPDGQPHTFERRHSRILAVLLLSPNQVVNRDYLIDAVWDETPPATAGRQLQNCISHLRQQLPGAGGWKHVIAAEPAGYRIHLDTGELDAQVFEAAVAAAQHHQAAGHLADAATRLREALALWQGPALAGMTGRTIEAASARLNEHRLTALENCLELELQQGRCAPNVPELVELVTAHPLRERMVGLLMRALHGTGRKSEALQAYDRLRRHLADELGLDPGSQLQELHTSLLRHEPASVAIGQTAFRQLPVPAKHFVGRDSALGELDRLAAEAGGETVTITVIHGTGGIGKTALGIRWAHRAAAQFPDGQLFVNLRGFHPTREPMPAAEAIRGFLDAFAIAAEQIPVSLEAQANLYRTLLAGRRMLIVLDNARDADQVRPLLPGGSGCMVIITSRNELTGLVAMEGAHPLTLGLLSEQEAHHLLSSHLGRARLDAEPGAVADLITRCAQLPLALAIIAARAAAHPTFPLATFSAELADTQRRLDAVDGGDHITGVRPIFSWSYQRLSTPAAHLFRLLGLHRGPDVTVPAAANLAAIPSSLARQLLSDLARAHLVTEHKLGRYTFHDLLSAYAIEQAQTFDGEAERRGAVRRLLTYDLYAAAAADALVAPHRRRTPLPDHAPPSDLPCFGDHAEALAWLEVERGNLVAAVRQAWEGEEFEIGWRLANLLWGLFHLEKHWGDWIGTHQIGLDCARACGNRKAEFTMLSSLGTAYRELGRLDDARGFHEQALQVSRDDGDRHSEAQALNGIGAVLGAAQLTEQARRYLEWSLEIRREIGDRWGEAITICNLGEQDLDDGLLDQAREHFLEALRIRQEIGDRWGEAITLNCLGQACHQAGQHSEAVRHLHAALTIHRQTRDFALEALDLRYLGMSYRQLGERKSSQACLNEAAAIYARLGMPEAEQVRALLADDSELIN
ncbi:SARP family transcriptional regulator [Rhizocola hellebori]|uniref:SARP family transcriptional regulator n=1 Tax=Rhizocola hellebori TaxID=1392758 RepID=A0A8J3Q9Q6_9ACTN|nr:SARP family transcriptional regulator [Rhizocola hellebori]